MSVPTPPPPRILVIDDVFGRTHSDRRNDERANLCGQLLLQDVTGDQESDGVLAVTEPVAQSVFIRGQTPSSASIGDKVENDLDGCLRTIRAGWTGRPAGALPWAMILLDLCFYTGEVTARSHERLPGMPEGQPGDDDPAQYFGLKVLKAIRDGISSQVPVVILSSMPRGQIKRSLDAHGALGFIARGEGNAADILSRFLDRHALLPDDGGVIVGSSLELLMALRAARRAAPSPRNLLLRGEQGAGKELLAAYVHRSSSGFPDRPFVTVDSGALSPELYGSELFGHRKGAYTGAISDRAGRIVQAAGGDLFLDEIGSMPSDVQVGLLRVLETRSVTPVGGDPGDPVAVRFLSATNVDIEGQALIHEFRADLLDRLRHGGTLALPPLRQRRGDIPLLVEHFIAWARAETPGAVVREVSQEAIAFLTAQDWPGNVRALESAVRRAVTSHPDVDYLFPHHFDVPDSVLDAASGTRAAGGAHSQASVSGPPPRELRQGAASAAEVVKFLEAADIDEWGQSDLAGSLPRLESAWARFRARLLRVALDSTIRPTPSEPKGRLFISQAARLLTGKGAVRGSAAADLIKRILRASETELGDLRDDPLLSRALETALKLRPRGKRAR